MESTTECQHDHTEVFRNGNTYCCDCERVIEYAPLRYHESPLAIVANLKIDIDMEQEQLAHRRQVIAALSKTKGRGKL
jgi:hypothetical protein